MVGGPVTLYAVIIVGVGLYALIGRGFLLLLHHSGSPEAGFMAGAAWPFWLAVYGILALVDEDD